ncbi:MAG TPA: hypothetical protein VGW75_01275 [Solirubrobacteraceae bacterium]|jgi:hypothetical protein|nr:hypothetical protein [Solirubrobacteraceae bacterium]
MSLAGAPPRSLFSDAPRTRTGPAPYAEPEYDALDRAARPYAVEVRSTLDRWFSELPDYARPSIRANFRSPKTPVHRGALLELYLHETFRRLGFEIDLDVGREDPTRRRPDFLLEPDGARTWVEATAVLGADVFTAAERARLQQFYDLLNGCRDKRFLLSPQVDEVGGATLGRAQILDPIEEWLAGLDAADVRRRIDRGAEPPEIRLTPEGWVVAVEATPVREDMPLLEHERVLGSSIEGVAELDDVRPLRRNLKRKATRYGALDAPYVIAVLCVGTFVEDRDVAEALLGDTEYRWDRERGGVSGVRLPNGLWYAPGKPANTRVSAVVTIPHLSATSAAVVEPTVWTNPWARRPLQLELPWRRQEIAPDGRITTHEAAHSAADILQLPPGWPHSGR